MSVFNIKQAAFVSQRLIQMFQIKLAVSSTFSLILWLELYILLSQHKESKVNTFQSSFRSLVDFNPGSWRGNVLTQRFSFTFNVVLKKM